MGALNEAVLSPNEVTGLEMHGTGTALGDPIEIGAAMGVMEGEWRSHSTQYSNYVLTTLQKCNLEVILQCLVEM